MPGSPVYGATNTGLKAKRPVSSGRLIHRQQGGEEGWMDRKGDEGVRGWAGGVKYNRKTPAINAAVIS